MNQNLVDYCLRHYIHSENLLCTLCGNSGVIDTRGVRSAAGVECGRLNYCICPNGQTLRAGHADLQKIIEAK